MNVPIKFVRIILFYKPTIYRKKKHTVYFRGHKRCFGGLMAHICYQEDVGEAIGSILAEIQKYHINS